MFPPCPTVEPRRHEKHKNWNTVLLQSIDDEGLNYWPKKKIKRITIDREKVLYVVKALSVTRYWRIDCNSSVVPRSVKLHCFDGRLAWHRTSVWHRVHIYQLEQFITRCHRGSTIFASCTSIHTARNTENVVLYDSHPSWKWYTYWKWAYRHIPGLYC